MDRPLDIRRNSARARLPTLPQVAGISVTAVMFLLFARVAATLPVLHGVLSPMWVPSGIALAAVLLGGRWMLAGVFVGDFAASTVHGLSPLLATGLAVGDTLEPLIIAIILYRFADGANLDRIRNIIVLIAAADVAASLSALNGVIWLAAAGEIPRSEMLLAWRLYVGSVITGIVLVMPAIVAWFELLQRVAFTVRKHRISRGFSLLRAGESLLLTALLVGTSLQVFLGNEWKLAGLFLLFPLFIWSTVRFGRPGATGSALLVAAIAVWGTVHTQVIIMGMTTSSTVQVPQILVAVIVLSNLVLAAALAERDRARAQMQEMFEVLSETEHLALVGGWRMAVSGDQLDQRAPVWCSDVIFSLLDIPIADTQPTLKTMLAALIPKDRALLESAMTEALQSGGRFSFEHSITVRGRPRTVRHIGHAIPVGEGEPGRLVGAVLDITSQQELDRMKDSFVATASHELRTPLTSILGFAHTLNQMWNKLSDSDRQQFLRIIEDKAERLAVVIDDTLLQSRVDSAALPIVESPILLEPTVRNAVEDAAIQDVAVRVAPDIMVLASPEALVHVITNFLTNAHKYGRPPIEIESRDLPDNWLELCVIDHGPGPDPAFVSRMFERFERGPETVAVEGTGLGLSIAKGLATSMGGSVEFRRENDTTVFAIKIRRAAVLVRESR